MASPKSSKPVLKATRGTVAAQDDDSVNVTELNGEDSSDDISTDDVEEVSAAEVITDTDNELVRVTMFKTVQPAPTVGRVSLVRDFGLEQLTERESYSIPRCVALVLVDRRAASIIG